MPDFVFVLLAYSAIGFVVGRLRWRHAKRMVAQNRMGWDEGPADFALGLFFWPLYGPWLLGQYANTRDGFLHWLMCAREPKKVRLAEQRKLLEKELEL